MICARHVVATRSSEVSRQSGQLRQKQAVVDLYRSDFVFMHQVSFVLPFGQMEFKHRVEAVKSAVMTEMDAKLPRVDPPLIFKGTGLREGGAKRGPSG